MDFHPIACIFPMMSGDELDGLVEDIRSHGCREPVILYEGKILDGRNRWTASIQAGVTPDTAEFSGSYLEAIEFVWSTNFTRRHLTSSQAAASEVARRKLDKEYAAAVESMAGKVGRPKKGEKIPQIIGELNRKDRETSAKRAAMAGTNRQYIDDAEKLADEARASEELSPVNRLDSGSSEEDRLRALALARHKAVLPCSVSDALPSVHRASGGLGARLPDKRTVHRNYSGERVVQ